MLRKNHDLIDDRWAKLKNGKHHDEKLKFYVGLTCLVFYLKGALNVVFFYLKYFNSTFGS